MYRVQRLDPREIPWDALDRYDDRVVFQTREWLAFIAESQQADPVVAEIRADGEIAGYFSGLVVRKLGLRILGSSFPGWTTPYIGFNVRPGHSRAALLPALAEWAFRDLRCVHLEISDRRFRDDDGGRGQMERSAYETYASDLTRSEDELFAGMDSACRRCIRKAEKGGVVIEEAHDLAFADEYYAQLKDVFAKQGKVPTYSAARVRSLMTHLLPTGRLLALRARNPAGACIATGLYPGMNDVAFFWGNASWRGEQHRRPNEYLHWYALRHWKRRGATLFDWGGGGTYKEKYGVQPFVVPWFIQSRYRAILAARHELRSLYYRGQRLIGRLHGIARPTAAAAD